MCVYFHNLSQYIAYEVVCLFTYVFIHPIVLPSSPQDISVTPLSNTSFMITWNMSDTNYNYTMIWTNLNTGVMYDCTIRDNGNNCNVADLNVDASVMNCTVQHNEISCNVRGLSDGANYNVSVAAVNVCGNKTSDPITVYGKYLNALM